MRWIFVIVLISAAIAYAQLPEVSGNEKSNATQSKIPITNVPVSIRDNSTVRKIAIISVGITFNIIIIAALGYWIYIWKTSP